MAKRMLMGAVKVVLATGLVLAVLLIAVSRMGKRDGTPATVKGRWRELRPPDFD